jgi:hypothetical protein
MEIPIPVPERIPQIPVPVTVQVPVLVLKPLLIPDLEVRSPTQVPRIPEIPMPDLINFKGAGGVCPWVS